MSICRPHGSSSSMLSVATHGAVMSFCLSLLVTFVSSAITELFEMQADFSGTKDEPCIILRSSFPKGKGEGQFVGVVQPVEKHFESVLWCSKKQ